MQHSPLTLLRNTLPELSGATLRIAELILAAPDRVGQESITKLARRADTSAATVTRLSNLLGFDGFPALRAAIATEHGRDIQAAWEGDIGKEITPDDPPGEVLDVLARDQASASRNALASVDVAAAAQLADRIAMADRVLIHGEWGDASVAYELYIRLFRIGIPVWHLAGTDFAQHGVGLLDERGVALVVNRSGNHQGAVRFLELANARHAFTATITGAPESPIAELCRVALFTGTRQGTAWTDYFAGRASDTLVAGLLFVLVAQRVSDSVAAVFETLHSPNDNGDD